VRGAADAGVRATNVGLAIFVAALVLVQPSSGRISVISPAVSEAPAVV